MSTETTTSKSDTPEIENIEQASSNFYWTYETVNGIFNLQTTIRGILSPDQIQAHIKSVLEANAHIISLGGLAKGAGRDGNPNASEMPKTTTVDQIIANMGDPAWTPEAVGEAPSITSSEPSNDNTFVSEYLVCTITNGKKYLKVKGGKWIKYGITIWDEVAVAAGIPVGKLEGKEYALPGYKATFIRKADGNPQKITKLEKVA